MMLNLNLILIILINFVVNDSYTNNLIDLSNQQWYLENRKLNLSLITDIPGSVHTTLLKSKIIKDPYVGFRDMEYAWIADYDWCFKTKFEGKYC